ncbi:hypothetical protein DID77_02985 [Candidatus Marinamargulisbacteria bacterium SCGC AG-439-L15]|nr:hypothetical protein DID77_02985 [Candidatus Marinamargulisbacteria bacterium SCGC AG-439-L15]
MAAKIKVMNQGKENGPLPMPSRGKSLKESFVRQFSTALHTLESSYTGLLTTKTEEIIITNLNPKRLSKNQYYILKISSDALLLFKQYPTQTEVFKLFLDSGSLHYNDEEKEHLYPKFLTELEKIANWTIENQSFIFRKTI